jgi:predicted DsbA family dithiol-disulfide isomerase
MTAMVDEPGAEPLMVEVVEYTDPWCSWAWGTEPKLRRLRWRYGDRFEWRTVMGDLVFDRLVANPDFDAARAAPKIASYWQEVHEHTGMPWPAGLKRAPRLSAIAGRAVKAAQQQSDAAGAALLRATRESCFVHWEPADTLPRVMALAEKVPGLDAERLRQDFDRDDVVKAFAADREETRRPNDYVLELEETHAGKGNAKPDGDGWRYVFPTVLFRGPGGEHTVPGWQPWEAYVRAMEAAVPGSTRDPRADPTPDEALDEWWLLTDRELTFLCGDGAVPPSSAVAIDWGTGLAFARADAPRPAAG